MRSRVHRAWPFMGRVLAVSAIVFMLSGCYKAARVFLDLPAPAEKSSTVQPDEALLDSLFALVEARENPEPPRPAIEFVADVDSVRALLPNHPKGGVDWRVAVGEGVVRPRIEVEGSESVGDGPDLDFGYDLLLGSGEASGASFPHSQHAYWLGCNTCHPAPYGRAGEPAPLVEVHSEDSCGLCHGTVAFSMRSCERCHEGVSLPERPVEDGFLSDLQMFRPGADGDNEVFGVALGSDDYPPATFAHGVHRVRYRCVTCHAEAFPITGERRGMDQSTAHGTRGCGMCHNGVAAFETGLSDCETCHLTSGPD